MKHDVETKIKELEKKISDGIELGHDDFIFLLTLKLLKTNNE